MAYLGGSRRGSRTERLPELRGSAGPGQPAPAAQHTRRRALSNRKHTPWTSAFALAYDNFIRTLTLTYLGKSTDRAGGEGSI
jgi:hypothetical protein